MESTRSRILVAFGLLAALFSPQLELEADPGTPPTIRVILPGPQIAPGRRMTFTLDCPCGAACGDDLNRDNVFIRRLLLGWDRMGGWFVAGWMRHNAATSTISVDLPPGMEQADDYVVTVWYGNASCWGQSQRFTIMNPGFSQQNPDVLRFPHDGQTLYRDSSVDIGWIQTDPSWRRVKIELLKGGVVLAPLALDTHAPPFRWQIGSPLYADGGDFRIRLTSIATGRRDESGNFTIRKPRLEVLEPRAWYRRNRPMTITWRSQGTPPGATFRVDLEYHTAFTCSNPPISRERTLAYFERGPVYQWTPPRFGDENWPGSRCFPMRFRVNVICNQCTDVRASSGDILSP